jgi:hypothetical protein
MFLHEIESPAWREDLPGAAARAKSDIPGLQEKLRVAEVRLGKATAECNRLRALSGNLSSKIGRLGAKITEARRLALDAVIMGRDDANFTHYRRLRAEREDASACLSYLGSWAQNDAEEEELAARIDERSATADLFEGQATVQRLAMAAAFVSAAMEYDPGATIATEGSWSAMQMDRVNAIRSAELPELRRALHDLQARAASERSFASTNLFT